MIFSGEGNQRTGKNIWTTAYALYLAKKYHCPIYANYNFKNLPVGVEFHYFEKFGELPRSLNNVIIVFDEIGTTMDARGWNGQEQTKFTHLFAQMGKKGNTFISTAQRPWLVEKRVREQADVVVWCDFNPITHVMTEKWFDTRQGRHNAKLIGKYIVTNPAAVYDKYDTTQEIASHVRFDDQINKK